MLTVIVIGVVCLVLLEGIVRLIFPRPRLRMEPQVQIDLDEVLGYCNRPNQQAFTVEAPAAINSLGFRGPEVKLAREANDVRILGLGNSLTFGSGVRDDETYLAYANKKLKDKNPDRRIDILNAAIVGFTIRQYIPFLRGVLPKVQPDIVLLGAHWRDLHFNPRFGQLKKNIDAQTWHLVKKKFKERVAKCDPPETLKEKFIRQLKNFIRRWRTAFVAIYYIQVLRDQFKIPTFKQWQTAFLSGEETEPIKQRRVETRKTLSQMKQICEAQNVKLAIVIFPDFKQLNNDFPKSTWPGLLTEVCDELAIPYLKLLPAVQDAYKKRGRSILMPYDPVGHYNIEGHIAIGEALVDFLTQEKSLHVLRDVSVAVVG